MLIVSNAEYSEERESAFEEAFPEAIVLFNRENVGFAAAVNRGLRAATGEFVMILNPDTVLLNDSCRDLLALMRAHREIGIAGPRLVDENGNFRTQREGS